MFHTVSVKYPRSIQVSLYQTTAETIFHRILKEIPRSQRSKYYIKNVYKHLNM